MRDGNKYRIEPSRLEAEASASRTVETRVLLPNTGQRVALRKQMATGLVAALLLVFGMLAVPATSSARVAIGISVSFGPPALPYYVQPPCPGPGYIWTPGYWAWDPAYGYYWVPGTWVAAPFVGALWTPGYWGFDHGRYWWHRGYWGLTVGFYGGINYGFGYTGFGYYGGYWRHNRFYYNRSVNRIVGRSFRHVYYRRVDDHFRGRRVSYHGGPGGINVRPTRAQLNAARHRRFGPVRQQVRHQRYARGNPRQRARVNHGRPDIAATRRAGEFRGRGIVRATRAGAPYRGPARRTNGRRATDRSPSRFSNRRGFERSPSANTQRHSAPQRRTEHRGFARENRGAPVRTNNQQRGQHQTRSAVTRGPRGHAAAERHSQAPRQERGHGGNGHGNEHGRGGRR